MSDQEKKSSIQALAAGILGFVVVVGLGGLLILHRGASADSPVAAYAPVDADSGLRAPARAAANDSASAPMNPALSSPAPLLSDEAREETAANAVTAAGAASANAGLADAAPSGAGAASASAGTTLAGAKLAAGSKIDALTSASSSASISSSSAAVAAAPRSGASAAKPFVAPKLDLSKSQGTIASTVHYGVSDRAELMGRAAGPVYNFSGKSGGQGGQVAAANTDASGAIRQMDAAQKQLDASDVPADEKKRVDQDLDQVRQSAQSAGQ